MSDNPFEDFSKIFNSPAPKSDLTPDALDAIRTIFREESAHRGQASGVMEWNKPAEISDEEWIDQVRRKFKEQRDTVTALLAEETELSKFLGMIIYANGFMSPEQQKDFAAALEMNKRLQKYLADSAKALQALNSLAFQVNAVNSEHEE